jgi:RHS repeat-associated protein
VGDTDTAVSAPSTQAWAPLSVDAAALPTGSSPRTLEVWEQTTSAPAGYYSLISDGDFKVVVSSGNMFVYYNGSNFETPYFDYYDGKAHLFDLVWDGTNTILYVDGFELVRVAGAAPSTGLPAVFNVGTYPSMTYDEAAVYPAALSATRVNAHWTAGGSSAGACASTPTSAYASVVRADSPVGYYRMDGNPSTSRVAYDSSGSCNNGVYDPNLTSVASLTPADSDAAMSSAATDSYNQLIANAAGMPIGAAPRSLEFWEQTTNVPSGYYALVSEGDFEMVVSSGNTFIYFNGSNFETPYFDYYDGKSHLWDLTFDGTTVRVYADGMLLATQAGKPNTALAARFTLGAYPSMTFDEAAVYSKALSPDRVHAHWVASGNAPPPPALTPYLTGSPSAYCAKCQQAALTGNVDPVDDSTGMFGDSFTDLAIPGRGPGLNLARTYRSTDATANGPFGYGWSWTYGASASVNGQTGAVTINEETGSQVTFNSNGSGGYVPASSLITASLASSGGGWVLTRRGGDQLVFNSSGQLTSLVDRNGNTTTLAYAGGLLSTVTDPGNRVLTFGWTGSSITSVHDSASPNRTVSYTYNGSGDLTDVQDVAGGHTDFAYTNHLLVTLRLPNFTGTLPSPVTNCTSSGPTTVVSNVYDANGRVTCQYDPLGRETTFAYTLTNGAVTATTVTDPAGNATADTFSGGLLTSRVKGSGSAAAGTWTFLYDPTTGGIAETIDPDGHATSATYDANGDVLSSTDGLGRTTTSTYNGFQQPLTATDPKGVTTTDTYDAHGNLDSSATPLLDANGNPEVNGQGQPIVSTTTYNHLGGGDTHPEDVTSVLDPDANTWTYTYDSGTGYRTSVSPPSTTDNTEHLGVAQTNTTDYAYNLATGWLTATLSPRGVVGGGSLPCTPPALGCTTYAYNNFGDRTSVADALNHTTSTTYDADRNALTTTDAVGNVSNYTYDAANEKTSVTQPDGTVTRTDYNADGTTADTIDALGAKTSYAYDARARVTSVTDPLSRVTAYGYDPAGNKVTKADPGGTCPTWPITYPPSLTSGQACTVWQFDGANEATNTYYSDGVTPNVGPITYDADSQRLTMPDGVGTGTKTWSWGWDSLHRATAVTDDEGNTVGYAYNLRGEATTITYPGTTGSVTQAYDAQGRMTSLTDPKANATSFSYNADSNPGANTLPSGTGVVDTNSYDNADRLTGITDKQGSTTFASFTYGYTNADQLNSVTSTGVPTDNHSYTYDPLERLAAQNTTLDNYDGSNNLTTTLAGATQYYDAANEVTASVAGPGITLVGTSTAANATGTTLTANYPAGTVSGDQLILAATMAYPNTLTVPSGWTQVVKKSSGSTSGISDTTYVLRHKTSSETSVTITFSGTFARSVALADYRGVSSSSPVDVSGSASTNGGTTVTTPSVTTTAAGDRVVVATGAYTSSTGTWSPPPTMTARAQSGTASPVVALDDQGQQTAGATGTRVATYSQSSQLAGIVVALKPTTSQPTATTYSYNTRGDRTGVTPPSGSASSLGYDQANRLTSFTQGSTSASYTYSGTGLRMSKTVGSVIATFTWDTTATVPTMISDGTVTYIYGPGATPLEQIDGTGNVTWYHHDQLGTTRVLTNSAGGVVGTFTYDAFGNETGHTGSLTSPLGYNGQFTDAESNLIYLRARYYDPNTGEFLSRDPDVASTLAAYSYAGGDPLNDTDPTGLKAHKCSPDDFFCLDIHSRNAKGRDKGCHVVEISAHINFAYSDGSQLDPRDFGAGDQIWFEIDQPDGTKNFALDTLTMSDAIGMVLQGKTTFDTYIDLPAGGQTFPNGTKVTALLFGKDPYGNKDGGYKPLAVEHATIHA